jgi:hypothetical protein
VALRLPHKVRLSPGKGGGERADTGRRFTHANNGYVDDRPYLLLSLPCCSRCCCLCIVCCCLQPPAEVVAVGRQRSISPAACTKRTSRDCLVTFTGQGLCQLDATCLPINTHIQNDTEAIASMRVQQHHQSLRSTPPHTHTQCTPVEGCVAVSQALPQVVSLST